MYELRDTKTKEVFLSSDSYNYLSEYQKTRTHGIFFVIERDCNCTYRMHFGEHMRGCSVKYEAIPSLRIVVADAAHFPIQFF